MVAKSSWTEVQYRGASRPRWVKSRPVRCKKPCPLCPPKADVCGALVHVCFGPEADITNLFDHIVGTRQQRLRNGEAKRLRGPLVDV